MFSLSSRTRSAPAGFIEPCLPSAADKPPSGSNWIHEIKHDGSRLMAVGDPVRIRLLTRKIGHCKAQRLGRALLVCDAQHKNALLTNLR
jgi:ATP-dependent DNA ligase